jgi:competence protein ComEC
VKNSERRGGPRPKPRTTRPAERPRAVRPVPPLLAAALTFAAAIFLALYRPLFLPLSIVAALLIAAGSSSRRAGAGRFRHRKSRLPGAIQLLALIFVCGSLLGARSGATQRQSCESSLHSGTPVRAGGTISEDHAPAGPASSSGQRMRIGLHGVTVYTDSGRCALPRLTAFVQRPNVSLFAGRSALLEGEWLRLSTEPAGRNTIDLPGRAGILVDGRLVDTEPGDRFGTERASERRSGLVRRRVRVALAARLRGRLPDDVDPTARALLLAERDELSPELRRRFVDAGLAHLLAISGLHVGIIAGLVLALLTPLGAGRGRYPLAAAVVAAYVAVIGAPIPALRSSLLFLGWAIARARGVPVRGADLLGVVALLFLVRDPVSLASPGFQLSFAGFAGVSLGLSACRERLVHRATRGTGIPAACAKALRGFVVALAAGGGAFLATAPVAAWHFGRVAPVSIFSSFVGTPVVALSIWSLVGALLPDPIGSSFAAAAAVLLQSLQALAEWFGSRAGSHYDVSPPAADVWLAWGIGFAALAWMARGASAARAVLPCAIAVFLIQVQPVTRIQSSSAHGLLCSLSVGQGDAAILRTRGGHWIVFDGGPATSPGPGREEIRSALQRRGARSVALVTVSHPDLDHIGGLKGLLAELPVGAVLDTGDPLPRGAYVRLLEVAEATGVAWLRARAGVRIRVDEAEILVLGPDPVDRENPHGIGPSANETSLVFRVAADGFRYLNSGDATVEQERRVLAAWPVDSLRADLLKIGHHGSRTSTAGEWIAAVRPRLAVISAGPGNRFGHPHPDVLRRIEQARVPLVWRTDRSGTLCIEYRSDGSWRIAGESAWIDSPAVNRVSRHED